MKKSMFCMATTFMLLSFIPMQSSAARLSGTAPIDSTRTVVSAEVAAINQRLAKIKEMDKSKLTFAEKRQLRKEVRSMKKQAANSSGGVYISVGALLIVIILLILLL
jgi:hypothetical protein